MTKRGESVRWWLSLSTAALVAASLAAGPASAADFTVNAAGDSGTGGCDATECTLREAVEASNAGAGPDTITFAPNLAGQTLELSNVGDGVYGPSALGITGEVRIEGPTGDDGVTISRAASAPDMRLLRVAPGGELTLANLTLSGGTARGGAGGSGGNAGGGAAGLGGAIVNEGSLSVESSTLTANRAVGGNGGNGNGSGCPSGGGGLGGAGGSCFGSGGGPNGGAINSNGRGGDGGFGGGGGGGTFGDGGDGGFGGGGGGGQSDPGIPVVGGDGGFGGGGGSGENGPGDGGFGAGDSGPRSRSGGGGGAGLGGAVFNNGGSVEIVNSTLSGNSAEGGTGGSGYSGGGAGQGLGGAVFNRNGTVAVESATLASNAAGAGGGIYNLGDGAAGIATLQNTIVADTPAGGTDFHASTTGGGTSTTSGSRNILEAQAGFGGTAQSADPNLGALADNGGPTRTHAPLEGSPAIDAGDTPLGTDQRGETRPYDDPYALDAAGGDGSDLGAFEVQTDSTPPTLSITDVKVKEGDRGARDAGFEVVLSRPIDGPVTVRYATADGSASSLSDYRSVTDDTLTIPAGSTRADAAVSVTGDRKVEKNETFGVTLSQPTSATLDDPQATATIKNDDRRR